MSYSRTGPLVHKKPAGLNRKRALSVARCCAQRRILGAGVTLRPLLLLHLRRLALSLLHPQLRLLRIDFRVRLQP